MRNTIVYFDTIILPSMAKYLFEETKRGLLQSPRLSSLNPKIECWNAGFARGENPKVLFEKLAQKKPLALILSGCEKSVTSIESDSWVKAYMEGLSDFLLNWEKDPFPILAICFAHQAIAQIKGGEVKASGHMKVGPVEVAQSGNAPKRYIAFHEDQVCRAPENMELLGGSDYCPYQSFKDPQLPMVTVQFHPEMNERILLVREKEHYWRSFNAEDLQQHDGDEFLLKISDWFAAHSKPSMGSSSILLALKKSK